MTESDGLDETFGSSMQSIATQAAALGRVVSQIREDSLRRAEREDRDRMNAIEDRMNAERQRAVVSLTHADRDAWWNTATSTQVAGVIATSQAWKDRDPELARLADRVDDRAQQRWGTMPSKNVAALSAEQRREDAAQVRALIATDSLSADDPLRSLVDDYDQRQEVSKEDEPDQETSRDGKAVSPQQSTQRETVDPAQDRADENQRFEEILRNSGVDQEAIDARMFPERANAKPANAAVSAATAAQARKGGKTPGLDLQRDTERGR